MKRFIYFVILLFVFNLSIYSNDVSAEENVVSDNLMSEVNLNENNNSQEENVKVENENLNKDIDSNNEQVEIEKNSLNNLIIESNEPTILKTDVTNHDEISNDTSEDQTTQTENTSNDNLTTKNDDNYSEDVISKGEKEIDSDDNGNLYLNEEDDVQVNIDDRDNHDIESIVDTDDRKIIEDLNKVPNKSIVFIKSYLDEINYISGTGFMIDDYTVLTAAHVVTLENKDVELKKIIVNAGYKDGKATLGTARVIKTYVLPEWLKTRYHYYDMALLILDQPLGKKLGKLKIIDKSEIGEIISTSGYPGSNKKSKDRIKRGNQYYSSGTIVKINDYKLYYDLDTEKGQSGSPVFNSNNDVIAIHTKGFSEHSNIRLNSGSRLSSKNIEKIKEWENELKSERFNKAIYVNKNDAKIWKDLNLEYLSINNENLKGKLFRAVALYTDSMGGQYLFLKDKDHKFIGFIDINDATYITPISANKIVQIKHPTTKNYKNFFEVVKSDTKLSFKSYYIVKEIFNLPNDQVFYSLYDKNNKWQGYINKNDAREANFEPYNERVEIINKNYTVWGNFFGKRNEITSNIFHKVYYAKGIYKANSGSKFLKIYDDKNKYLGFLNMNATKKIVAQKLNKNVKVVNSKYNFYNALFNSVRTSSKNHLNKTYAAKTEYRLSNGKIYYSLYDSKSNWIGYIEKAALKIL